MPRRKTHTAAEAARALGISLDTLRRWDRAGRIRTERDSANRRLVPAAEIARLKGRDGEQMSARNHFRGVVREVKVDGLLAQVELDVTEPARVVAIITRDAAEELGLRAGMSAAAVGKAASGVGEVGGGSSFSQRWPRHPLRPPPRARPGSRAKRHRSS